MQATTSTTPRFLRACHREPVDRTPVWFMRQAGRSLPEYRAIKERHSLFEITHQPELCAQVTLQPVRRLGVDAAIIYSDITSPLAAIGVDLDLVESVGPVIARPLRTRQDIETLRDLQPAADMPYALQAIDIVRHELADSEVAVIGFAGAPFTLACYLIEGRSSRDFVRTKQMMYSEPELWNDLMERLTRIVSSLAEAQVAAGAQAVQIFDSWVGNLSPRDYERFVQPHMRALFDALTPPQTPEPVPLIHFGTGTATLLKQMADAGGDVIGLDWRVPLDVAWTELGGPAQVAVQGNLDPAIATAPWDALRPEIEHILSLAGGRPGHIFNLGHGVLPVTPVENLERIVEYVHSYPGTDEDTTEGEAS